MYTPESSCMKKISVHIKNTRADKTVSSVIVRFESLLWLYGSEKVLELSRNGAQGVRSEFKLPYAAEIFPNLNYTITTCVLL